LQAAPLKEPRAALAKILRPVKHGVHLSDHVEADGPIVFRHACKLGLEGIVSKRKDSPYRSGRTPDWLKSKNPASAAVRREAEEDCGQVAVQPASLPKT
jgi:bifunctional non-homologous end joining protein LigD